ncbi:MAG: zinc ribbon domain-containing protein [Dehalococcoidia bacterium]|nr:zinc ribbon domain-containing protein [Dehalococcoidia bacterium]
MPIYQYDCNVCSKRVDVFFRSISAAATKQAVCPRCGSTELTRAMSTFTRRRTSLQRLEDIDHVRDAAKLQGHDPAAFAEWAKHAGREWDEELGTNWSELGERAEAGEDLAERVDADYAFRYRVEDEKHRLGQAAQDGQPASADP